MAAIAETSIPSALVRELRDQIINVISNYKSYVVLGLAEWHVEMHEARKAWRSLPMPERDIVLDPWAERPDAGVGVGETNEIRRVLGQNGKERRVAGLVTSAPRSIASRRSLTR